MNPWSGSGILKIVENDNGELIALGDVSGENLLAHYPEFQRTYDRYIPDTESLEKLRGLDTDFEVRTILATWCNDSARVVPRMMRVADLLNGAHFSLSFYCVDRPKLDAVSQAYSIEAVPTLVVMRDNREIGRIIESPSASLEADLMHIINGQDSQ